MKAELQKKLLAKYPEFFTHVDQKIYVGEKPVMEEVDELIKQKEIVMPIQFGFDCGDGWYWLLNSLMDCIHHYSRDNDVEPIHITQIKEKYGGLSFYYHGGDRMITGMVWLAEDMSRKICEYCGTNKNVGMTQGWMSTICKECHTKIENRKNLEWIPNEK